MIPVVPERARQILERFPGHRLAVFGDFMLDRYVWGEATRISPEAPVPILRYREENHRAGGAANVVRNLAALGGVGLPVGVVGEDAGGEALRGELAREGVAVDGLLVDPARTTTEKTRYLAGHHPVARLDREDDRPLSEELAVRLIEFFRHHHSGLAGLIVSDYEKGVVTPATLDGILGVARERNLPVFVDPKTTHFPSFRDATLLTPNLGEAGAAAGWTRSQAEADLPGLARRLQDLVSCRGLLVTRGERGMVLFEPGRRPLEIPAAAREVYDVTGAGDTVIAVASLAVLAGASLAEASYLANRAAGLVVGKLGTATVTCREILGDLE